MSYYGGLYGAPVAGSVFGGYPGGYDLIPGGVFRTPLSTAVGSGAVYTLGTNLPKVSPTSFPGTVHYGPPTVISGPVYGLYSPDVNYFDPIVAPTGVVAPAGVVAPTGVVAPAGVVAPYPAL